MSRYICLGVNTPFAWWNWFTQEGTSIWKKDELNFPKCLEGKFLHCKISYLHKHYQFMLKWKNTAPCTVLKYSPQWVQGLFLRKTSLNYIRTSAPTAATGGTRAQAWCVTMQPSPPCLPWKRVGIGMIWSDLDFSKQHILSACINPMSSSLPTPYPVKQPLQVSFRQIS